MLKYITRLLPTNYLRLPLLGTLIVVSVIASKAKPVSSNQLDADPYSYRTTIPDSGAVVEAWREPEANVIAQNEPISTAPVTSTKSPEVVKQPLITALIPDDAQAANRESGIARNGNFPSEDGIYLYGQSSKPEQIGQSYVVFEKRQGRVTGALYMPQSEYSCFNGSVDDTGELAMTVNGYAGDGNTTEVASNNTISNVKDDESTIYAYSLPLRDFYRLNNVTVANQELLRKCQEGGSRE